MDHSKFQTLMTRQDGYLDTPAQKISHWGPFLSLSLSLMSMLFVIYCAPDPFCHTESQSELENQTASARSRGLCWPCPQPASPTLGKKKLPCLELPGGSPWNSGGLFLTSYSILSFFTPVLNFSKKRWKLFLFQLCIMWDLLPTLGAQWRWF